jgi:hypothetical protein
MIVRQDDGWLAVDFADWTPAMMGLAYVLSTLPPRPGTPAELLHSYPIGIERLREAGGDAAVEGRCEVAGDLDFRPDLREVVELGEAMIRTRREMLSIQDKARDRGRTPTLRRSPRARG